VKYFKDIYKFHIGALESTYVTQQTKSIKYIFILSYIKNYNTR